MIKKYWKLTLAGILIVHLILLIYLKFTAWPEMTLWPYLITKGWLPYKDIAIAHTPLMLMPLALIYKIFGVGIIQLKIFTWILILGINVLVFLIAKILWNTKTALFVLMSNGLWLVFYDGNGLWFDLFMGVLAFVSYYCIQKKKYLWAGIFWGLAFISKQTAVWFLIPIGIKVISERWTVNSVKKFIIGAMLTIISFLLILWSLGIFPSFIDWAVQFGIFILPKAQGQIQLPDLKNLIVSIYPFLIFIPLFLKTGRKNINLLIWAIAGCLGAYPRFEYFHFQPALPFLAIASGLVFSDFKNKGKLIKLFIPIYLIGSIYLFAGFFMRNFREGVRFYEKDVENISQYVKSHTNSSDTIFVMNWWDNIYAFSDRLPATRPWVPQLSWYMETSGIQEKLVNDLAISKPKLILINPYSQVGLSSYVPKKVYDYVISNYQIKEKIDGIYVFTQK